MRQLLLLLLLLSAGCRMFALSLEVNVPEDTVIVNRLLTELREQEIPLGDKIILAASQFVDSPEDDYYLTDSIAALRINLQSFSPLMFINSAIALAKASERPGHVDSGTFALELENIACRRGENRGFPSIMYHTSDWFGDNSSRGNLTELTENFSGVVERTKSLDDMTRKRGNFAALADSATFETVRMSEMGFRTHRIPTLKRETIKKKDLIEDLRNGDIIIMVPNRDGTDWMDMGFVVMQNGEPHLLHVSPKTHAVVLESDNLGRYMDLMAKHFQGYRIIRVKE